MKYNLVLLIFIFSCNSIDTNYIKKNEWEFARGYKLGPHTDFITFGDARNYTIKNNVLCKDNVAVAHIIKLDKKEDELYLQLLTNDSISIYFHHDFFK